MILHCVRHGESSYNAQGRIQGQTDIPLSPRGQRQSLELAQRFVPGTIAAIYSSPLLRARQTAEPIAQRLELELQIDPRLQEIHAGIFQGLLWSEIRTTHPREAAQWLAQEPDFEIPGGESRRALGVRGRAALEEIHERGQSPVIVVSHGGLLGAAIKSLLEIPAHRIPFQLFNASISTIVWDSEFRLLTLNQIDHLTSDDRPSPGSALGM